jgi:hypothetical protein
MLKDEINKFNLINFFFKKRGRSSKDKKKKKKKPEATCVTLKKLEKSPRKWKK